MAAIRKGSLSITKVTRRFLGFRSQPVNTDLSVSSPKACPRACQDL